MRTLNPGQAPIGGWAEFLGATGSPSATNSPAAT
jgi:hypothetical protein